MQSPTAEDIKIAKKLWQNIEGAEGSAFISDGERANSNLPAELNLHHSLNNDKFQMNTAHPPGQLPYTLAELASFISREKLSLTKESITQSELAMAFECYGLPYSRFNRHTKLDDHNIPDFFDPQTGTAIEIKIKGQKSAIYEQCKRYLDFDQMKMLILVTNKSMTLPPVINGKPCRVARIGRAWL